MQTFYIICQIFFCRRFPPFSSPSAILQFQKFYLAFQPQKRYNRATHTGCSVRNRGLKKAGNLLWFSTKTAQNAFMSKSWTVCFSDKNQMENGKSKQLCKQFVIFISGLSFLKGAYFVHFASPLSASKHCCTVLRLNGMAGNTGLEFSIFPSEIIAS